MFSATSQKLAHEVEGLSILAPLCGTLGSEWLRFTEAQPLPVGRRLYQPIINFMGIDIYACWKNQDQKAKQDQKDAWSSDVAGDRGYLREAYHGEPYATAFLCAEAFAEGKARIAAAVLRARLPRTLALAEERERKIYRSNAASIKAVKKSYQDFVGLCEAKERETGTPVEIIAWY